MCTMTGSAVMWLLPFILLLVRCNGQLVLYIQSTDNETACPPNTGPANCRLLSEYAADFPLPLDPQMTFVFLPGVHILNSSFRLVGTTSITFRPLTTDTELPHATTITCNQSGEFCFEDLEFVNITLLEFSHCDSVIFSHCGFGSRMTIGLVLNLHEVTNAIIERCNFTNNYGALNASKIGALTLIGNQFTYCSGQWMYLVTTNATFTDNLFAYNNAPGEAGIYILLSFLSTTGTNVFHANSGIESGVMYVYKSTVVLDGNTTFTNNLGEDNGAVLGILLKVSLRGNVYFENNTGRYGGVFGSIYSQFNISGKAAFVNNHATYGGTFYILSSAITFLSEGNVTFLSNSAINGGALFLASGSSVNFVKNLPGSVSFENNSADMRGGAIFIQDSNTLTYCLPARDVEVFGLQECTFQIADYDDESPRRMYFCGNYAGEAGSAVYGGAVDECILDAAAYLFGDKLFKQITEISGSSECIGDNTRTPSTISSDPFILCPCIGKEPNCAITYDLYFPSTSVSYTVYPGASLQVAVVALGQRKGTVPATVRAYNHSLAINELENAQGISNECNNLSYTIYAEPGYASLELYTEGACLERGIGLTIEVEVLSCPPGFVMSTIATGKVACTCDTRLTKYTDTCSPQDGTILRDDTFWVGYDKELDGIILYSTCPFDYCITDDISFRVEDSNSQCNHSRSGLLCGECPEGLSLLLGSTHCDECSNSYLALLLFFAAAGLILVAFLLLLNLTVASGTINGLVFYANIVAANETLFFPSESNGNLEILHVFIAWINLDFGIESCFYDGMDAYAKTWLQYVFPLYIWALIGLVFLVAHFSSRASKILGSNPVAVLATLLLLSYTNILHTIIEAFSWAKLDYPRGESRLVWLQDGNIPFLDASDGRHIGLFVASFLVLLLLFIPYTLMLLTSQWLQIKSHWKVLSWLNKPQLRSFLDAYHAPYKPRHRYWTGLLLLVRFALLLTTARTSFINPSIDFLVLQIFVLFMLTWALINGGVYKKWYLNILESFFFLNLGLLAASTHHIKFEFDTMELTSEETKHSQTAITSTLVTATIVTFIGIISYHIYLRVRGTAMMDKLLVATRPSPAKIELKEHVKSKEELEVTTSYVTLREPLLEDN